jgi:hypothetical protein
MENPTLIKRLRAKGEAGTRIRMLFGDPASSEVGRRSEDEGIGKTAIGAKIRNLTWLKLVRTAVVDAGEGIAEVVG